MRKRNKEKVGSERIINLQCDKKEMETYKEILKRLREKFFFDPCGDNVDVLMHLLKFTIDGVVAKQGNGPLYPYSSKCRSISEVALESHILSLRKLS